MADLWTYDQAVDAVSNWFSTDADNVWNMINEYNLTPDQTASILPTTDSFLYGNGYNTGYTAVKAADGSILSWNNVAPLQSNSANPIEQAVNSNAGTTSQQIYQLPASTDFSGTGGTFHAKKGLLNTPVNQPNIMSQVSTGVAAAGLGIKLGKVISKGLYYTLPFFFDNIDVSTFDPATWNKITVDMSDSGWEGTLKRAFNAIFGLDPSTGKSQMYLDADAAAYLAMYMQEMGVFSSGNTQGSNEHYGTSTSYRYFNYNLYTQPITLLGGSLYFKSGQWEHTYTFTSGYWAAFFRNGNIYIVGVAQNNVGTVGTHVMHDTIYGTTTTSSITMTQYAQGINGNLTGVTFYGKSEVYDSVNASTIIGTYNSLASGTFASGTVKPPSDLYNFTFGGTISGGQSVEGITNQDGATQPDFTGCETPADYKQALQTQFPDMFQNAITQNVAQPNGTVVQKVYVPVGTPEATGTQDTQPVTNPDNSGQSQSQTEVDPQAATQTIIETILKYIENIRTPDTPDTPNPPDTGEGSTPTVVTPTGNASALWSVYNPTQAQLNSFGAWLWSSNFIDQLLKLFNNPMQSIIGVHKIFATPATSGAGNITVGYLSSGVSANLVSNQYTDINCGTVKVSEQFGNVFDYTDTQIRLYLPFIGIVDLDVSDVMRGSVSVVYHVDVITGACLSEVKITRDGGGGTLYQYAGDAAVRYPISSGSYMGVVAGIASAVGGVASAVMTGGATLPMAAGAIAGGISGAHTQVQHSGNFSGNAGAMGGKKPYLIIERPQTMLADGFASYQGKGANARRTVGQMSGYFKFSDVHTDYISGAAESEIEAIRAALESGVIA